MLSWLSDLSKCLVGQKILLFLSTDFLFFPHLFCYISRWITDNSYSYPCLHPWPPCIFCTVASDSIKTQVKVSPSSAQTLHGSPFHSRVKSKVLPLAQAGLTWWDAKASVFLQASAFYISGPFTRHIPPEPSLAQGPLHDSRQLMATSIYLYLNEVHLNHKIDDSWLRMVLLRIFLT